MKKYLISFLFLGLFSVTQNVSLKAESCCMHGIKGAMKCDCAGACVWYNPLCSCLIPCSSDEKRITLTPEQSRLQQEIIKEYNKSKSSD